MVKFAFLFSKNHKKTPTTNGCFFIWAYRLRVSILLPARFAFLRFATFSFLFIDKCQYTLFCAQFQDEEGFEVGSIGIKVKTFSVGNLISIFEQ